jgi:hypothetical protein
MAPGPCLHRASHLAHAKGSTSVRFGTTPSPSLTAPAAHCSFPDNTKKCWIPAYLETTIILKGAPIDQAVSSVTDVGVIVKTYNLLVDWEMA